MMNLKCKKIDYLLLYLKCADKDQLSESSLLSRTYLSILIQSALKWHILNAAAELYYCESFEVQSLRDINK